MFFGGKGEGGEGRFQKKNRDHTGYVSEASYVSHVRCGPSVPLRGRCSRIVHVTGIGASREQPRANTALEFLDK
ncbi:hypothetical protein V1478_003002 [Vespula squamosa]|uniref:Uncharacterized protein n=1 Tax=Vespula squamosa TaxID=30214 RepID=A0ABD2BRG9_VESSQ